MMGRSLVPEVGLKLRAPFRMHHLRLVRSHVGNNASARPPARTGSSSGSRATSNGLEFNEEARWHGLVLVSATVSAPVSARAPLRPIEFSPTSPDTKICQARATESGGSSDRAFRARRRT